MKACCLTELWVLATLLALFSCRGVCFSQQTVSQFDAKAADEPVELTEARAARASAEQRARALELEIERLRGENQALKSRYAGLYLRTYEALERLRKQELAAANLIQGESASGRDDALEALDSVLSGLARLQEAFAGYRSHVLALAKALQASDAAKAELERRSALVQEALSATSKPLVHASGAGRSGGGTATVLAVDAENALVILDRGRLAGIQPGTLWFISGKDGTVLAKLKTVECRTQCSAAVVTEGDFLLVRKGASLSPLVKASR